MKKICVILNNYYNLINANILLCAIRIDKTVYKTIQINKLYYL